MSVKVMFAKTLYAALASTAILLAFTQTPKLHDPQQTDGDLFVRRCSGCHSLDLNKEGPRLRGVYGRKAAGVPGFGYSEALQKADFRWDDATLDRWLTDPAAMLPGSDMDFHLAGAQEREAVIAWLKSKPGRKR